MYFLFIGKNSGKMGITDTCSKNPKKLKQKTPSEYCYKHRFMECQILIIQIRFDDLIHYLIINLYANEIICALIHLMLTVNFSCYNHWIFTRVKILYKYACTCIHLEIPLISLNWFVIILLSSTMQMKTKSNYHAFWNMYHSFKRNIILHDMVRTMDIPPLHHAKTLLETQV